MAARQKGGHMTIDSDAPHPPRTRYAPRLRLLFAWVLMTMIMSFFFPANSHPAWGLGDGHDDVRKLASCLAPCSATFSPSAASAPTPSTSAPPMARAFCCARAVAHGTCQVAPSQHLLLRGTWPSLKRTPARERPSAARSHSAIATYTFFSVGPRLGPVIAVFSPNFNLSHPD